MNKKKEDDTITVLSTFNNVGEAFEEIIAIILEQEISLHGLTTY